MDLFVEGAAYYFASIFLARRDDFMPQKLNAES